MTRTKLKSIPPETKDYLQEQIDIYCNQAHETIQKRAISWVKFQLTTLTVFLSILVFTLGILGFKKYSDLSEKYDQITNLEIKADTAQKIKQDIDTINEKIIQLKLAESKITKLTKKIAEQEKTVAKIDHGRIKIALHYLDANPKRRNQTLEKIDRNLKDEGFKLYADNVSSMSSNKTEVLYYNPFLKDQAIEIAKLLRKTFPGITERDNSSEVAADPNHILIKIAQKNNQIYIPVASRKKQ